jgi:hypothetical protein
VLLDPKPQIQLAPDPKSQLTLRTSIEHHECIGTYHHKIQVSAGTCTYKTTVHGAGHIINTTNSNVRWSPTQKYNYNPRNLKPL